MSQQLPDGSIVFRHKTGISRTVFVNESTRIEETLLPGVKEIRVETETGITKIRTVGGSRTTETRGNLSLAKVLNLHRRLEKQKANLLDRYDLD